MLELKQSRFAMRYILIFAVCCIALPGLAQPEPMLATPYYELWRGRTNNERIFHEASSQTRLSLGASVVLVRKADPNPNLLLTVPQLREAPLWAGTGPWGALTERFANNQDGRLSLRLRLAYQGGSIELMPRRDSVWLQWKIPVL